MRHTATIAIDSSKSSLVKPMPAKVASNTSLVSPWLTSLLYPLGHYVVLPFYFGQIEIAGQEHLPKDGACNFSPYAPFPLGCPDDALFHRTEGDWTRFALYGHC